MGDLVLLGRLLRVTRLKAELSVGDLARMALVSRATISRIERGLVKEPQLSTLQAMAAALNVPWDKVLPYLDDGGDPLDRIIGQLVRVPVDCLWIVEGLLGVLADGPPPTD